jgi:hypothetical protein
MKTRLNRIASNISYGLIQIHFRGYPVNRCDLEERDGNMSRDEGWALFKKRVLGEKEFRGYYQANCSQATVAFRFDSKILAYPPYPATEKTLLPNNSDPSSVAAKPICYLRGFEKKWVLPFEMKTAYNLPQKW